MVQIMLVYPLNYNLGNIPTYHKLKYSITIAVAGEYFLMEWCNVPKAQCCHYCGDFLVGMTLKTPTYLYLTWLYSLFRKTCIHIIRQQCTNCLINHTAGQLVYLLQTILKLLSDDWSTLFFGQNIFMCLKFYFGEEPARKQTNLELESICYVMHCYLVIQWMVVIHYNIFLKFRWLWEVWRIK